MSTDRAHHEVEQPSDPVVEGEATSAGGDSRITAKLKELLAAIVSQNEDSPIESADDVSSNADFAELGVNSVDFLEFVTSLEREFNVEVPDEVLGERSLISLDAWTRYLSEHSSRAD